MVSISSASVVSELVDDSSSTKFEGSSKCSNFVWALLINGNSDSLLSTSRISISARKLSISVLGYFRSFSSNLGCFESC